MQVQIDGESIREDVAEGGTDQIARADLPLLAWIELEFVFTAQA
jgi:hypothetical protein